MYMRILGCGASGVHEDIERAHFLVEAHRLTFPHVPQNLFAVWGMWVLGFKRGFGVRESPPRASEPPIW